MNEIRFVIFSCLTKATVKVKSKCESSCYSSASV